MTKLLRENHRADGITELTLDLNGVRVITVSVPTVVRHELSDAVLDTLAMRAAESAHVTRNDPPRPGQPS